MLKSFRHIITMSMGYLFAVGSILIMYTLLPIIFSKIWWTELAWIAIMIMTMLQIFLFWPLAANLVDHYGAKKILFAYVWFFIIWSLLWYISYHIESIEWKYMIIILMALFFSAGFACKFVDVYTLRTTPSYKSWMAFWILISLAGLWRFLGTLIQPHLIHETTQIYAPLIMIVCMILFWITLTIIKSDLEPNPAIIFNKEWVDDHIKSSLISVLHTYKRTFGNWRRFIKRCRQFPIIPLTVSFFEGIYFWSLWFIVPLYLNAHQEFSSTGLEIGIYEIISVCVAVFFWYVADRGNNKISSIIWWCGILLGIWILYFYPSIELLVYIGIIIWLSNNLLYSTGQHILSINDVDHENDGAYAQTRNIISNIGYMFMPVMWWWIIHIDFSQILQLFSIIIWSIALFGLSVTVYLLIFREKSYFQTLTFKFFSFYSYALKVIVMCSIVLGRFI